MALAEWPTHQDVIETTTQEVPRLKPFDDIPIRGQVVGPDQRKIRASEIAAECTKIHYDRSRTLLRRVRENENFLR